jgi:membrane protease YdiL (CAAX protease family)
LTLLAAATGRPASTRLGLGLTATVAAGAMLPSQLGWWPLPGLVGACVYVVAHLAARTDPTRDTAILRLGRLTAAHAWMVAGLAVSSGAVLLIFSRLAPPRLGTGASFLLDMTPWTLVAAGVTFAVVNALVEEVLFRGAVLHHLGRVLGNQPAVFVQALAFGIIHLNGYPHGLVGATLAAIYGLLLGALRLHTGGLLAPWLAHLCADAVIFALLVDAASQAR